MNKIWIGDFMRVLGLLVLFFMSCQSLDGRLYFLHIPKTAGTSLRLLLESQVCAIDVYPCRNQFRASRRKTPVNHRLVSGHFSYSFCKDFDREFEAAFKITTLRDPIERYLAQLRDKKIVDSTFPDLESVIALRHSLEKKDPYLVDNCLCRSLAADPLLEGEALLESAKETLRKLDCVLFFEHFTEDVIHLFKRFGIDLAERDVPRVNMTVKESVSEQLLKEIESINLLDIELYQYAKMNLSKKTNGYSLRDRSFDALLQKSTAVKYIFDFPLNGRGWSYRENLQGMPVYRWVMDQPASIYFSLNEGSSYDLYFAAKCLTNEIIPEVSVGGKLLEVCRLNDELFSLYHAEIPEECVAENLTEIVFHSAFAYRYTDKKNNRHHPFLSFGVSEIQISSRNQ